MTLKDLVKLERLLKRIKDPDGHVREMIAAVEKDLAIYDKRRGQLREQYEADFNNWL